MPEKTEPKNFSVIFTDYQTSIGSQGPQKVSPLLNELSLYGHFQRFNSSHETIAYDLRELNSISSTNFYL